MQGRKGEGTGGAYTKPNPEQLIDVYSKAYHALQLTEIPKVDPDEFESMKQELESLRSMVITRLGRFEVREEKKS